MKKRKTENYIIIGTTHLGMDVNVLRAINTTADFHNAKVIHVGNLATDTEISMWRRREKKLRTWEKARYSAVAGASEKINDKLLGVAADIDNARSNVQTAKKDKKLSHSVKLQKLKDRAKELVKEESLLWSRLGDDTARLEGEKFELEDIQWGRIATMREVFGDDMLFVSNDELSLPNVSSNVEADLGFDPVYENVDTEDGEKTVYVPRSLKDALKGTYIDKHLMLGKHLYVTAVPANGDRMAGAPITPRTFKMLREMGHSHILPHMTPHVKPFPRPGLNQAFNYWTTGAIQVCGNPKRISDAYLASARAACVLVSIDSENGEFHAQRLMVKPFSSGNKGKKSPCIIHDGVVFDSYGEYEEVDESNKAMHSTDMHAPHEHMGVVAAIRAVNVLHRPSVYVDGGDTIDNSACSPHTKGQPGEREGLRIIDDLNSLKRILNVMAGKEDFPWIKERVLLDSNHGEWLTRLVNEYPNLKGLCDWPTIAKMIPNWNVFIRRGGEDRFYTFGDLSIKHADKEGSIERAFSVYGNYLGGHHHSFQEIGEATFAGPGCRLGPKFLQNSATSWQNQLTSITRYRGRTCKHPKTVFHTEDEKVSRFAYRGQIYQVKYHTY